MLELSIEPFIVSLEAFTQGHLSYMYSVLMITDTKTLINYLFGNNTSTNEEN